MANGFAAWRAIFGHFPHPLGQEVAGKEEIGELSVQGHLDPLQILSQNT